MLRCAIFLSDFCRFLFKEECRVYSVVSIIVVGQIVSAKFGGNEIIIYLCGELLIIMDTKMSKEDVLKAWKKALGHEKEARVQFEKWLQERGIEGKVVSL